MTSVNLYQTDINQLPTQLQKLLPIDPHSTWYDTYRRRFPDSGDKVLFIITAAKARILESLKEPFILENINEIGVGTNKFIFINDPTWIPLPEQRISIKKDFAKRITIGTRENEITDVIELELGNIPDVVEKVETLRTSTPKEKPKRESKSLDRIVANKDEMIKEQRKRINNLKDQLEREEKEKLAKAEEVQTIREKAQLLEKENETLTGLQQTQEALANEEKLRYQEQMIAKRENDILDLEQKVQDLNISKNQLTNHHLLTTTAKEKKKPSVNVGKIQVPIYDEATGDIYETLERLSTVLSFAENNRDLMRTIIYNFLQKNSWETMINSNAQILDDFEILRKELIERHDPQRDSTEKYINISQRSSEDEKDYMGRLERGYRIFMKIKPNVPLTTQQREAVKTRFAATLLRKDVRLHMKGQLDQVSFEEIADKARKYRRVVEMEEESNVLISTNSQSSPSTSPQDDKEPKKCKFCRLPHDSSECNASEKFRRKSNKRYLPPSKQSFTIPQQKLGQHVKFNNQYPPAEPTENEGRGRDRYRDQYFRKSNRFSKNYSSERRPYQNFNRSRSREYNGRMDRSRSREDRKMNNRYTQNNWERRRQDGSWPSSNSYNKYRRNNSWNNHRVGGRERNAPTRLVNLSQTIEQSHPQSILKAPVESEVHEFLY